VVIAKIMKYEYNEANLWFPKGTGVNYEKR